MVGDSQEAFSVTFSVSWMPSLSQNPCNHPLRGQRASTSQALYHPPHSSSVFRALLASLLSPKPTFPGTQAPAYAPQVLSVPSELLARWVWGGHCVLVGRRLCPLGPCLRPSYTTCTNFSFPWQVDWINSDYCFWILLNKVPQGLHDLF